MPDCFPEGNAATIGSDTRRSWIKMNDLGPSSGAGSGVAITLDDESTAITLDDETTAFVIS